MESSGFSFLRQKITTSDSLLPSVSSPSLLRTPLSTITREEHDTTTTTPHVQLFKVAEVKPMKKKKRAPKVGFARDMDLDDMDDEEVIENDDKLDYSTSSGSDEVSIHQTPPTNCEPPPPPPPSSISIDSSTLSNTILSLNEGHQQPPAMDHHTYCDPPPSPINSSSLSNRFITSSNDEKDQRFEQESLSVVPSTSIHLDTTTTALMMSTMKEKLNTLISISNQRIESAQKMATTWSQISLLECSMNDAISAITKLEADHS